MKQLFYFPILILILGCSGPQEKELRIIAEYEPHEAIFIGFRNDLGMGDYDRKELETLDKWDSLNLELAKLAQDFVHAYLMVGDTSLFRNPHSTLTEFGIDTSKVKVMYQPLSEDFYQDPAPLFGLNEEGSLMAVDFKWTGYSNISHPDSISEKAKIVEAADRHLASALGLPMINLDLALEGGAWEANAKGTVILTEKLMKGRNPEMSLQRMEEELATKLNIKQVIWLPQGAAEDPQQFSRIVGDYYGFGTGGHTDEYVRFANDSTILLAWVNEDEKSLHPIDSLNYINYMECLQILQNTPRPDGGKYTIVKIPSAPLQEKLMVVDTSAEWSDYYLNALRTEHGDTLIRVSATSYMNFVITNGLIIAPKYFYAGMDSSVYYKDEEVASLLKSVFPEREIKQLDPSLFNYRGGGLHCRFKELPSIKSLN